MHQELIEQLLFNSDAGSRRRAAEELIAHKSDGEGVIKAFVSGLTDGDKGVRDICALGLVQSYKELVKFKAEAVAALVVHTNIEVRNLAADILLQFGSQAAEALYPYLQDRKADNRKFACDILGLSGNAEAISVVGRLLHDEDANVRCAAIEALGHLRASVFLEPLLALYNQDEEARPYIITAIGQIGGRTAQKFLQQQLHDPEIFLRIAAIDALSMCAEDITIARNFLEHLAEADPDVQLILLKAIYGIAFRLNTPIDLPEEFRDIARNAMMDDDRETCVAGLLALGHEYHEADIPALLHELMANNLETQKHILYILLAQSSPTSVGIFFDRLFDNLGGNATEVVEVFGCIASLWNTATTENATVVLDTITRQYVRIDSELRNEVVELLLSINRERLVQLLARELLSEQLQRVEDASYFIESYSIKELQDSKKERQALV